MGLGVWGAVSVGVLGVAWMHAALRVSLGAVSVEWRGCMHAALWVSLGVGFGWGVGGGLVWCGVAWMHACMHVCRHAH